MESTFNNQAKQLYVQASNKEKIHQNPCHDNLSGQKPNKKQRMIIYQSE